MDITKQKRDFENAHTFLFKRVAAASSCKETQDKRPSVQSRLMTIHACDARGRQLRRKETGQKLEFC